ncbi:MAG TPA: adenylate/guanylate cyclase domain-containing protein, partial [Pyrinomonadaceae bacterium]|nr:adenylate/guanylate cyclase domain-containing protein [Pyrinomonadaceae bacterium]
VQQLVAAGQAREVAARLEEGRYRLRASAMTGARALRVAEDGAARVTLRASEEGWPGDESEMSAEPLLNFENATQAEQLFILERTAWSDQAATAAEVTALQLFRDLFAEEALRPGEQISVGQLTLVFTDLRSSTQLYREIGDAVAFGTVMSHFDVLREAIADEGGSIVKTLGDAVMAVFTRPAPALRAVMRAQKLLASPPAGARPLMLKAGIHTGPCIAVTLNGRLDYFGSNVNIAARLEPLSTGADCVISESVHSDPKVASMLAGEGRGLAFEPLRTSLKGFDAESFELWRVVSREEFGGGGETSDGELFDDGEAGAKEDVRRDVTAKVS